MSAKTGFKRFFAAILSLAMIFSTFAGMLPGTLVFAAVEDPEMHIIIKHWHADGVTSNYKVIDVTVNSNEIVSTKSDNGTKPDSEYKNNKLIFNAHPDDSSETFSGFAVSAGNDCVTLDTTAETPQITVQYNPNVHLVKVHVFYSAKPKLVPGTEMQVGTGTGTGSGLEIKEYEDTSTQKWGDLDKSLQEDIKAALGDDGVIDPTKLKDADLIKLYNTSEGLHTDKTATPVYYDSAAKEPEAGTTEEDVEDNGTRVFDINLEAWYNDQATAKVGLILDASGSMAFISDGLEPMHFDASAEGGYTLPDGITNVQPNVYLTLEQVGKILDKKLTDNSKLSYSDYSYYIFDTRDFTQEFVPLAYWGGENGEEELGEITLESIDGSYLSYWNIENDNRNKEYYVVKKDSSGQYQVDETYEPNRKTTTRDSAGTNKAIQLISYFNDSKGSGNAGYYMALKDSCLPKNEGFTVTFAVQCKDTGYGPLLSIGPKTATSSKEGYLFTVNDKKQLIVQNKNNATIAQICNAFDSKINTSGEGGEGYNYFTFVFSNDNKLYSYLNGELIADRKTNNYSSMVYNNNSQGKEYTSLGVYGSDLQALIGGFWSDESHYFKDTKRTLNIDDIVIYDAGLDATQVKQMYNVLAGESSTVVSANTNAYDDSGDNVIATYDAKLNAGTKADRAGWYFVNSGSDLTKFYETVGTAKEFKGLPADEVIENEIVLEKLPQSVKDYFEGHEDDVTNGNGGYIATSGPDFTGEGYLWTGANTGETVVVKAETGYKPAITLPNGVNRQVTGYSPCVFFIDDCGFLRCFYNNGAPSYDGKKYSKELRSGVSYVFKKEDNQNIKSEDLQYALGEFVAQLHNATPNSMLSAVRFSNQSVKLNGKEYETGKPTDSDYTEDVLKKLVMLDWTSDTKEISQILSLERGNGGMADDDCVESDPTGKDGLKTDAQKLKQYNYGMTGGTYTWTGFQAYTDFLDKRIVEGDPAKKYIILFTDGMDNMLDKGEDEQNYAINLAKALKDKGYTIFCVVLKNDSFNTGAAEGEKTRGERVREYMAEIAGNTSTKDKTYDDLSKENSSTRYIFEANDVNQLTEAFTGEILRQISSSLLDYSVQDYIDPRFDIVDGMGNTIVLGKGGQATGGTLGTDYPEDYKNDEKIGTIHINDGETAILCYNAAKDRYYLEWLKQDIPGTTPGQNSLTVWSRTFRVKAKEDFIGGNAVLSNGNGANENWVFNEKDIDEDNVNADASSGVDDAILNKKETDGSDNLLDPYVSKGFPRTAVNVRLLKPTIAEDSDKIYMGETIDPKTVAKDIIQIVKDDYYWEYLKRYYSRDPLGELAAAGKTVASDSYDTAFENAIGELLDSTHNVEAFNVEDYAGLEDYLSKNHIEAAKINTVHKLTVPYTYLPNQAGNTYTNTVGNADYQKDQTGSITYMIIQNTPNDELGGKVTTEDTNERSYIIWVQFNADQIEATSNGRKDAITTLLSGKDTDYPWNSGYKPAAGKEQTEQHIEGPYNVDIVKGEIWLDWDIDQTDIDYLKNHFPNLKITYSVPLIRNYTDTENNVSVNNETVGTFKFTMPVSGLPTSAGKVKAEFECDPKYEYMLKTYGLPIGQYSLGTPQSTFSETDFKGFEFNDPVIQDATEIASILDSTDNNYYVGYGTEPNETKDTSDNAAKYSVGTIYLGNGSSDYDENGEIKDGSGAVTRRYTDDRLGLIRISGDPNTGTLAITKNVDYNTVSYGNTYDENTEFTFEVTLDAVGTFDYTITGGQNGTLGVNGEDFGTRTITLKKDQKATIEGIPVGTTYTVKEVSLPAGYKANPDTATTGTIIEADKNKSVTVENKYTAYGELTLDIAKVIAGRDWINSDKFTFEIKRTDTGAPDAVTMPENTTITINKDTAEHKTSFDKITFNKVGTYEFKVTETSGNINSLTCDPKEYTVKVIVTNDSSNAKLNVAATYVTEPDGTPEDYNSPLSFTNTVEPIKWSFDVTKNLTGRDWLNGETFTFDVTSSDGVNAVVDSSPVTVSEATNSAKVNVTFSETGEYTFTVKENGTDGNGLDYDTDEHKIVVTVGADATTGALEVTKVTVDGTEQNDPKAATKLPITNTYKASGEASVKLNKEILGRDFKTGETFKFDVTANSVVKDGATVEKGLKQADFAGELQDVPKDTVISTDDKFTAVVGKDAHDLNFAFSKAGTYTFTIKEQPVENNFLTEDSNEVTVTFKVTDNDHNGKLAVETSYKSTVTAGSDDGIDESSNTITFINKSEPITWSFDVTKNLTGRDWKDGESFTFGISLDEKRDYTTAQLTEYTDSITVSNATADHKGTASVKFYSTGTYTFTIQEQGGNSSGLTYDTDEHKIVVTVGADATTGALEVTKVTVDGTEQNDPKAATKLPITNTYKASGEATFTIQKTLENIGWDGKTFTFTLEPVDGNPDGAAIPANIELSSETEQTFVITFSDLTFDGEDSKVYNFTLTENGSSPYPGIDYDDTAYTIEVNVTDNGDGTINPTVKVNGTENGTATFTNTYSAASASWTPQVKKTLTGRDWAEGDSFTFTLAPGISNPADGFTMPVNTTAMVSGTSVINDSAYASFDAITFTKAGTYSFTISENDMGVSGLTYDKHVYRVTVIVEDNTMGGLKISQIAYNDKKNPNKTVSGNFDDISFGFENVYNPIPVDWTPQVTKVIANKAVWNPDYVFNFTITPPKGINSILAKETGGIYTENTIAITDIDFDGFSHVKAFPTVTFKAPGVYEFTIQEEEGGISAVTYDAVPHTVIVTVTDVNGMLMITNVSGTDMGSDSNLTVVNTYSTSVPWPPIVEKTINGREWLPSDAFTFELSLDPGFPQDAASVIMPADSTITLTQADYDYASKKATGMFATGVEFTNEGTYRFILREKMPEPIYGSVIGNMIYDASRYIITVEVIRDYSSGELSVTSSAVKEDAYGNIQEAGGNYRFTNIYNKAEAEIYIRKELEDWKNEDIFTFDIALTSGDPGNVTLPFPAEVIVTKDNPTVSFGDITFTESGEYTFTVTEMVDPANVGDIVYAQPQTVTVNVSQDPFTGQLTAIVIGGYDNINTPLIFTNYYIEEATLPISVTKEIEGWKDGDSFTFDIALTSGNSDEVIMPNPAYVTVTKDNPTAAFGDITFTEAGVYTFDIAEQIDTAKADEIVYAQPQTVTVNVSPDMFSNKLIATVDGGYGNVNTPLIFTNYYIEEATLPISVTKEIEGWKDGDSFTFDIALTSGNSDEVILPNPAYVTVTKDNPTAVFGDITFTEAGVYTFDIVEQIDPAKAGEIVYAAPQTVTVTVSPDMLSNKLIATVDGGYGSVSSPMTFINSYKTPDNPPEEPTPPEPTASLTLSKVLLINNNITNGVGQFKFRIELIGSDFTDGIFNNGVADVTLASGESITFEGLPVGTSYTVSEYDSYGYTLVRSRSSGLSGTLSENVEAMAVAVNVYVDKWRPQTPPPVETPDNPPAETVVELPTEAKRYDEDSVEIPGTALDVCLGIAAIMLLTTAFVIELKRRLQFRHRGNYRLFK